MTNSIAQKFNTKSLLFFTLPSMIMMVFCSIYSMTGSIYAAQYINQNAMAAINVVFPLVSTVLAVAIMFATGSIAIVAKNLGEGDSQKSKENFTVIFIVGALTGLLFTCLTRMFDDTILQALGTTPELLPYSKEYLNAYALIFPFMFLRIFSQYYFVSVGKPLLGMILELIGGFLNILLNHILIAILQVGIVGAAIASASSFIIPGIVCVIYFLVKRSASLHFVKPKLHKRFLLDTCTNGSSEMVTNLAISIITAVLNIIMGRMAGEDGIAAVGVIVQVQFLLNSLFIGFGAGVAPIFAFAYGEDNRPQIKTVFKIAIRFVGIASAILVLLCLTFNEQIVSFFISPDSTAFPLALQGFTIFSLGHIFAGTNIFASVFFTSVSNGKISALISFLRTFLFILGMLLILPSLLGISGVWIAIPIAEILGIIVSIYLLLRYRKIYHY